MDGISRSRGWDKEIPHGVLPMKQLVLSDKWARNSFGVVRPSIPSVHTFCLSVTISQYLLARFDSSLVQMRSTMDSRYPISLIEIDSLTLELLPLF